MKQIAWLSVCAAILSTAGAAQTVGPSCGLAQLNCECGSLFRVLQVEGDDPAFQQTLADLASYLQQRVRTQHGSTFANAAFDAWEDGWRALPNTIETSVMLAETLSRCSPFLTGADDPLPNVVISP